MYNNHSLPVKYMVQSLIIKRKEVVREEHWMSDPILILLHKLNIGTLNLNSLNLDLELHLAFQQAEDAAVEYDELYAEDLEQAFLEAEDAKVEYDELYKDGLEQVYRESEVGYDELYGNGDLEQVYTDSEVGYDELYGNGDLEQVFQESYGIQEPEIAAVAAPSHSLDELMLPKSIQAIDQDVIQNVPKCTDEERVQRAMEMNSEVGQMSVRARGVGHCRLGKKEKRNTKQKQRKRNTKQKQRKQKRNTKK